MDNLKHLIIAYFYELWDQHEYASWQEAVDDFVRRSPERARSVPDEIDDLLAAFLDNQELSTQLAQWGFDADPADDDRAWLSRVGSRIRDDLAAEPA